MRGVEAAAQPHGHGHTGVGGEARAGALGLLPVPELLAAYFSQCSIEASCADLAPLRGSSPGTASGPTGPSC